MQSISSQFSFSIFVVILLHICSLTIVLTTKSPKPRLLITRLVHYDSIYSPYYNVKQKKEDLVQIDLKNEISRGCYLQENSSIHPMDIETSLTPNVGRGFLAHLEVGEKRTPQFVYMDTGSSLLWINCEPCCTNIPMPIFHPLESSTYKAVKCYDSQNCGALGGASSQCDSKGRCHFELRYVDGTIMGHVAKEEFRFGVSDEILQNIVFGCAKRTSLYANGVLGLGMSPISLIGQMSSSKFSHCFGNISDTSYKYNTLIIGDGIELMGAITPMIIEGKYYITLESIRVGNTLLKIDQKNFARNPDYTGGMVIDTGSTYTFLPKEAVEKIETEIIGLIEFSLTRNYSHNRHGYNMLCYNGILSRDLKGFPTVSFSFKDDATMELDVENIFRQLSDQSFCLAILPSENINVQFSILGNRMMQYFYIVYDLAAKTFSFVAMECSSLGDYIGDERLLE